MPYIAIHHEDGAQLQASSRHSRRDWQSLRVIRERQNWELFDWESNLRAPQGVPALSDFEARESKDAFLFLTAVPGATEADLDVKLTQNRLTVSGVYATERRYGSFRRSVTLPPGVDIENIQAELKQGMLMLSLPKLTQKPTKGDVSSNE